MANPLQRLDLLLNGLLVSGRLLRHLVGDEFLEAAHSFSSLRRQGLLAKNAYRIVICHRERGVRIRIPFREVPRGLVHQSPSLRAYSLERLLLELRIGREPSR